MTKPKEPLKNDDDLAIRDTLIGCESILEELATLHKNKKKQIENSFQMLLDSLPSDITNLPINQCIEDYLEIKAKNANKIPEVIDQSICDSTLNSVAPSAKCNPNLTVMDVENETILGKNGQQGGGFSNLTSTVKKVNSGKLQSLKQKIDEQSMIEEVDDLDETPIKDQRNVAKQQQQHQKKEAPKPARNDQYAVRVLYFLKDFTQISTKLQDLNSVELKLVHENCIDDINLICKALSQ